MGKHGKHRIIKSKIVLLPAREIRKGTIIPVFNKEREIVRTMTVKTTELDPEKGDLGYIKINTISRKGDKMVDESTSVYGEQEVKVVL